MTDTPNSNDPAERLRRLQERRAASGRSSATPTAGTAGAAPLATGPKRSRRRHPAAATRILLAGLSVTGFFSVAAAIAAANGSSRVATPATAGVPATKSAGAAATAGTPGAATVPNTVAHTTTGGS